MRAPAVRHFLLTGVKRGRAHLTGAVRGTPLWSPLRAAYRAVSPLWRIMHTEDAKETEITFAHDNERHYRELDRRVVKKLPYPFNLPGQSMTFEMYEQATRTDG